MKRRATPRGKKAQPRRVTFAGARRLALALPGVVEGTCYGTPAFRIAGRFFFRLREDGESLAIKIDFDTREALLQANPRAFFITDHFRGYPAMCVHLSAVRRPELKALLDESWRFIAGSGRGQAGVRPRVEPGSGSDSALTLETGEPVRALSEAPRAGQAARPGNPESCNRFARITSMGLRIACSGRCHGGGR